MVIECIFAALWCGGGGDTADRFVRHCAVVLGSAVRQRLASPGHRRGAGGACPAPLPGASGRPRAVTGAAGIVVEKLEPGGRCGSAVIQRVKRVTGFPADSRDVVNVGPATDQLHVVRMYHFLKVQNFPEFLGYVI